MNDLVDYAAFGHANGGLASVNGWFIKRVGHLEGFCMTQNMSVSP